MPARPFYRSRFLIAGVTLLALGAGNAIIGSRKLAQYQHIVTEGREQGYLSDDVDAVLRPADDEGERYNIARAKVDLYHVVLSGGLLMLAVGAVLTLAAWVRLRIRRDGVHVEARTARRRVAGSSSRRI